MKNKKIQRMTVLAMMMAILLIFMLTPLGYIPVGVLKITTMHIPVILTGMILGKKEGMFMGLLFGLTSVVVNTLQPTLTSFVFSPFISLGEAQGNWMSLIVAILPRVFLGWSSAFLYARLKSRGEHLAIVLGSALSTFCHTFLVLALIYLFFGQAYASTLGVSYSALITVLMTTVLTNGILEIIIAVVASLCIVKNMRKMFKV